MDLSHWDLVDGFTLREAACLAGGVDPKLFADLTVEQKAKSNLIHRELEKAYELAISAVTFALNAERRFDPNETWESIFPPTSFIGSLPSNQLFREVNACIDSHRKFDKREFFVEDEDYTPVFSRKHLDTWFSSKGFKPTYRFVPTSEVIERQEKTESQPLTRNHVSNKLAKVNQAAAKFWGNAERDDRGTHPDNAMVVAWLIEQGLSATLAEKAATIIRPEWAPSGRKPEE